MSENTEVVITKQFLDKEGLDALWEKICTLFIPEEKTITLPMIDAVWDDIIGIDGHILDNKVLNNSKLYE